MLMASIATIIIIITHPIMAAYCATRTAHHKRQSFMWCTLQINLLPSQFQAPHLRSCNHNCSSYLFYELLKVTFTGHFSLLHRALTGSEAHPASYPMGTGGLSPGVKWQGREADHSPHLVPRSRMVELYLHSHIHNLTSPTTTTTL
jgi:hypothetical protein